MTKATYRRIYMGLIVPEGEAMTILSGSMAAGRQAGRHGTENSHLETQASGRERAHWEWHGCLKPQSPAQ